ncbi:alkaline phosphatase D family protein [Actinopolymorpha sp. B11F2]|uniref:alkaline phosphatase D family protein n=1 Tax=Actinopolymorpha sp. B11F2 TaxID=3160862 RepID=UPI0032E5129A
MHGPNLRSNRRDRPRTTLGETERRSFLTLTAAGAAAVVFGVGPYTDKAYAETTLAAYPFTLGVASGDPLPDGVVLWTRLAPDPLALDGKGGMPAAKVAVRWKVAEDEGLRRVVQQGTTWARPELAHAVHIEVGGLRPGRWYFYQFESGTHLSMVGRTRTAPTPGDRVAQLAFAFASCQAPDGGHYTAYQHMANEDLDLVLHLGDYIYENPGPAITLDDYRVRHAEYRLDVHLQATHAAFPWVVTWDDHDVDNDYAGLVPHTSSATPTAEAFHVRRANAYRAFYEHLPLRRSSVPTGPDMRIYRRLGYGRLADFSVLDTRQYRHDQVAAGSSDRVNPARSILGQEQEEWLHRGLGDSAATWKIIAQQIQVAQIDYDIDEGEAYYMDAWDGYPATRDRLFQAIQDQGVDNIGIIAGDLHQSFAADLKADFRDPDSATLGVEHVGTSISSNGDGIDTTPGIEPIMAANPHIKFNNAQRGYVRCVLTPEQWRADYRVVPYISQPGAAIYTRASFVTENGNPGLHQVADNAVPSQPPSSASTDFPNSDAMRRGRENSDAR